MKSSQMKAKPHFLLLDALRGVAALIVLILLVLNLAGVNLKKKNKK